uniref:Immunoglobulin domain-containing protein n=1 Tax=Anabas testudineus TaxID=64144 RepID=A0A3Q1H7W7_ANATE
SLSNMSVHLSIVLFFTGLTGLHSITTVSEVSVKAGRSISIPCLYDSKYTHHVKYLCKGYYWMTCSYTVKTDQPGSSQKFSISDDKDQRIFNVTINNLTDDDSYYWCAVEIQDDTQLFLSFPPDDSTLYVDHQEMTGFNGGDVTISCYHSISGEGGWWCRLGGSCVMESSGSIDGTTVIISVNVPGAFTVTMRGLRTESSGWYYCVKGDLQMPVHLTVNEKQERPKKYYKILWHNCVNCCAITLVIIVLFHIATLTAARISTILGPGQRNYHKYVAFAHTRFKCIHLVTINGCAQLKCGSFDFCPNF